MQFTDEVSSLTFELFEILFLELFKNFLECYNKYSLNFTTIWRGCKFFRNGLYKFHPTPVWL